jgi:hypothetical protein
MQAATTKIGRNDPCHCGSGQKYKKCHAAQDEAARAAEAAAQAAAAVAAAAAAADEEATAKPTAPSGTKNKEASKHAQAGKALRKPPMGPPPARAARRKNAV